MYSCMESAIEEGKRRFKDNPRCFINEAQAIKVTVSEFLWEQLGAHKGNLEGIETLELFQKVTK